MLKQYLQNVRFVINHLNVIAVIIMAAYVFLVFVKNQMGYNLYYIPGILLLFYLPGRLTLQIYAPLQNVWGKIGQLALSILISFSIMASVMIVASRFAMTDKSSIYLMILINGLLLSANVIRQLYRGKIATGLLTAGYKLTISDVLILFIPLAVVVLTIGLSPLASDADGFMSALKNTIDCSCVSSPFRPLFTTFFALIYHATGLSYLTLFRIVYPLFFIVSMWFLFDYAKRRIGSVSLRAVAYLALLSAPVTISEINIIRPQVAMLVYTLPVLMLLIESWRAKHILFALMALWFGLVAVGFHELSIILFTMALLVTGAHLTRLIIVEKRISWQSIVVTLVIVYPYTQILHVSNYLNQLVSSVRHAESLIPKFHWRWWFIDDYVTIDGINIGWPGVQAVYFYAYSGVLLLLITLSLCLWLFIRRHKMPLYFLVPGAYALVFLVVAELLPRLGFFFLPNRAWVHLILAISVLFVLIIESYQKMWRTLAFPVSVCVLIIVGVGGATSVAHNNVAEVFRGEIDSVKYIQRTPANSVFFSSQDNHTLVQFYGGRTYTRLSIKENVDLIDFHQLISDKISDMYVRKRVLVSPEIKEVTQKYIDGQFVSEITKLLAERQFAIIEPQIQRGTPIYFIYSMRKSSGTNASRGYLANSLDVSNKEVYQNTDFPVAYQDESVIILKLR